ncbi:MAG: hypothetical protein J6T01_01980 [Kiritimatiellae bacterium]|nr:hypothetical protein [Kiritimatiellia bacterium]
MDLSKIGKRFFAAQAVAAAVCLAAFAAAADNFPNADGSGDLASAAAWGNPEWFPGETSSHDVAFTNKAATTYTASGDVTFGNFINNMPKDGQMTVDVTGVSPRPKLTFKGFFGNSASVVNSKSVTLKGGDWNFSGGNWDYYNKPRYGNDITITVSDGAVVTNLNNYMTHTTTIHNNRLILTGSGTAYYLEGYCYPTSRGADSQIQVLDGALFYLKGELRVGKANSGYDGSSYKFGNMGLLVSGAGSKAYTAMEYGDVYLGIGDMGSFIKVENGGYFKTPATLRVGTSCGSNRVSVLSGSSAEFKVVRLTPAYSNSSKSRGNVFEVGDGATASVQTFYHLSFFTTDCRNGNSVVISNGTLDVQTNFDCSNSVTIVRGTSPKLQARGEGNTAGLWVRGESLLRIELPPGGYAEGHVPVDSKYCRFKGNAAFEVTGAEELKRTLTRRGVRKKTTYTLVRWQSGVGDDNKMPLAKISAVQETLPKGCRIYRSDNTVKLDVTPDLGAMIFIR